MRAAGGSGGGGISFRRRMRVRSVRSLHSLTKVPFHRCDGSRLAKRPPGVLDLAHTDAGMGAGAAVNVQQQVPKQVPNKLALMKGVGVGVHMIR